MNISTRDPADDNGPGIALIEIVRPVLVISSTLINITLIARQGCRLRSGHPSINHSFTISTLHLGIANLLLVLLWVLPMVMWYVTQRKYTDTDTHTALMFLGVFSQCLLAYSTVAMLVFTVVEKIYQLKVKPVLVFIVSVWVFSAILAIPEALVYKVLKHRRPFNTYQRGENFYRIQTGFHQILYQWFLFVFTCVCPLLLSIILVLVLCFVRNKEMKYSRERYDLYELNLVGTNTEDSFVETRPTRIQNPTGIAATVGMLYAVMWMPYFVAMVTNLSHPGLSLLSEYEWIDSFVFWTFYLGMSNSFVTPFVIVLDSFVNMCDY